MCVHAIIIFLHLCVFDSAVRSWSAITVWGIKSQFYIVLNCLIYLVYLCFSVWYAIILNHFHILGTAVLIQQRLLMWIFLLFEQLQTVGKHDWPIYWRPTTLLTSNSLVINISLFFPIRSNYLLWIGWKHQLERFVPVTSFFFFFGECCQSMLFAVIRLQCELLRD